MPLPRHPGGCANERDALFWLPSFWEEDDAHPLSPDRKGLVESRQTLDG